MNIIVVSKHGTPRQFDLTHPGVWGTCLACTIVFLALIFGAGFFIAGRLIAAQPAAEVAQWKAKIAQQSAQIEAARAQARTSLDALSLKLGQLQAHIIRLDALGQQLTKMAGLDSGEFNFNNAPAEGGPEIPVSGQAMPLGDFIHTMNQVATQISDRQRQLSVLENLLMNRNLQKQVRPAGRPIETGWISSYFGLRTDPFTGHLEFHEGMDFAGKKGTRVESVAAGVVVWAGRRSGYGNLVEIDHGNGYTTWYGHNAKILVKVGETVKKGQVISLMGSTGRSTGPHVHFEVRHNGVPVNPRRFVQAATG